MVLDIIKIEYFFIILELHTVEYLVFPFSFLISRRSSLLYLLSNSPSIYSQSLAEISIDTPTWNMSSQRKWQAFMAKVSSISAKRKEAWIWFACQVLFLAIFFENSWRTFNASSCISSHKKLLEYHASSWHGHASHLMVCWLMSNH